MECFVATHGHAWDRHKIGGPLLPPADPAVFTCTARQTYRFFCEECGADETIPGPHGGPHEIVRTFAPSPDGSQWRYTIAKHGYNAWMDLDETGFLTDSLGLDFGPWYAGLTNGTMPLQPRELPATFEIEMTQE